VPQCCCHWHRPTQNNCEQGHPQPSCHASSTKATAGVPEHAALLRHDRCSTNNCNTPTPSLHCSQVPATHFAGWKGRGPFLGLPWLRPCSCPWAGKRAVHGPACLAPQPCRLSDPISDLYGVVVVVAAAAAAGAMAAGSRGASTTSSVSCLDAGVAGIDQHNMHR
jgi:hypothetical protein